MVTKILEILATQPPAACNGRHALPVEETLQCFDSRHEECPYFRQQVPASGTGRGLCLYVAIKTLKEVLDDAREETPIVAFPQETYHRAPQRVA